MKKILLVFLLITALVIAGDRYDTVYTKDGTVYRQYKITNRDRISPDTFNPTLEDIDDRLESIEYSAGLQSITLEVNSGSSTTATGINFVDSGTVVISKTGNEISFTATSGSTTITVEANSADESIVSGIDFIDGENTSVVKSGNQISFNVADSITGITVSVNSGATSEVTSLNFIEGDNISLSLEAGSLTVSLSGEVGVTDHGELTGLSDDDHTQYSLVNGTRAFTSHVTVGSNTYLRSSPTSVGGVYTPSYFVGSLLVGTNSNLVDLTSYKLQVQNSLYVSSKIVTPYRVETSGAFMLNKNLNSYLPAMLMDFDGSGNGKFELFTGMQNTAVVFNSDGATSEINTPLNISGEVGVDGTVTATAFIGDGSALTGIVSLPDYSASEGKYLTVSTGGTSVEWSDTFIPFNGNDSSAINVNVGDGLVKTEATGTDTYSMTIEMYTSYKIPSALSTETRFTFEVDTTDKIVDVKMWKSDRTEIMPGISYETGDSRFWVTLSQAITDEATIKYRLLETE